MRRHADLIPRDRYHAGAPVIVPRFIVAVFAVAWLLNVAVNAAGLYARLTDNAYTMTCSEQLSDGSLICAIGGDR